MSYLTEQRQNHVRLVPEAASSGRYDVALFHAAEAARLSYRLAERTGGVMARAYLDDGDSWLRLAEQYQAKRAARGPKAVQTPSASAAATSETTTKSPWHVTRRPTEKFSDVVGLEEIKRILRDNFVDATKFADAYRTMGLEPGGGALMYGPPGNGKTLIARAIAGELDADFFVVSGSKIKNKYVGGTEKNMRRLFEEAARCQRAVVFIDEVQSLLSRRGSEKASAVDEFLVAADGFEKRDNMLLLLGATNFPWMIDGAALRRFSNLVYVGMPDENARRQILELQFRNVPILEPLAFDDYAKRTSGLSGADIARVAKTAKLSALRRMIDANAPEPCLAPDDVELAIRKTRPTVPQKTIEKIHNWETEFFGEGLASNGGWNDVE